MFLETNKSIGNNKNYKMQQKGITARAKCTKSSKIIFTLPKVTDFAKDNFLKLKIGSGIDSTYLKKTAKRKLE